MPSESPFIAACEFFATNGNISQNVEAVAKIRPMVAQLNAAAIYAIKVKKLPSALVMDHVTAIQDHWKTVDCWDQKDLIQLASFKDDIARATQPEALKLIADELVKRKPKY